jgi:hypothetical protein
MNLVQSTRRQLRLKTQQLDSKFTHSKVFDKNNQLESRRAQGDDIKVRLISIRKLELVGVSLAYGESEFTLTKQGVCRSVALPFPLKSILRQKKNYGNSITYFTMQKIYPIFKKNPLKETKIFQDIITL